MTGKEPDPRVSAALVEHQQFLRAVARKLLERAGIEVTGAVEAIAGIESDRERMEQAVLEAREAGDSVGGIVDDDDEQVVVLSPVRVVVILVWSLHHPV